MDMRKTRLVALVATLTFVVASCAAPDGRGPDGRLAMQTFGRGVLNLMLSPVMIVAVFSRL